MTRRSLVAARRSWAVGLTVLLLCGAARPAALAQGAAGRPVRPAGGGFTPFRGPGVRGTSFGAASLEQPGCPIHLSIEGLRRTERGVVVSLRLANLVEGPLVRQVLGAWVLAPDGTVRGTQRLESSRPIDEASSRAVDLILRTVTVMPNDIIVVAVQEAMGASAWRRDRTQLETEVRTAIVR